MVSHLKTAKTKFFFGQVGGRACKVQANFWWGEARVSGLGGTPQSIGETLSGSLEFKVVEKGLRNVASV